MTNFEISEQEAQILAVAEHKARENGVCWLRFAGRNDGGVTVTEETDHVEALQDNG